MESPLGSTEMKFEHDRSRKLSVFFTSSKPWNEESLAQGCRDMSPTVTSIFEAAWNGDVTLLEELLRSPRKTSLANVNDIFGRTPLHLGNNNTVPQNEIYHVSLITSSDVDFINFL